MFFVYDDMLNMSQCVPLYDEKTYGYGCVRHHGFNTELLNLSQGAKELSFSSTQCLGPQL